METRIESFQVEGTWEEVVAHGDRISRVLRALGPAAHPRMGRSDYDAALEEWDSWRPEEKDSLDEDVGVRTAELASLKPGPGEQRGRTPGEDLKRAGRVLLEAPPTVPDGGATEFTLRLTEAARLAVRAADTGIRGLLRTGEEAVYLHVMTKLSPYYFDNRVVSANLDRVAGKDGIYRFEVDVNNDDLKGQVSDHVTGNGDSAHAA